MLRKNLGQIYYLTLFLIFMYIMFFTRFRYDFFRSEIFAYLGVMVIPITIFLLLFGFVFSIKNRDSRSVYELKLYLFVILSYGIMISAILNLNYSLISPQINLREIVRLSLVKYHFGYVGTYFIYKILSLPFKFKHINIVIAFINISLFLIILFSTMKTFIQRKIVKYKEDKELQRQEIELREQILIRENAQKRQGKKIKSMIDVMDKKTDERVRLAREKQKLSGQTLVNIINLDKEDKE